MRYCLVACLTLMLFITACQGPPPTQIVIVVTATQSSSETEEATAETVVLTTEEAESTATPTAVTPQATATLNVFPTPTTAQIQVAEQVFEGGRMFWIQPREQVWVMIDDGSGKGEWTIYEDSFTEGEPEFDATLDVPEGKYQPERGFGKLWRENPGLKDALGWGLTPEFGYVSNYEYHPGGEVDSQNQYAPGPGYHILFGLSQEKFRFNEVDGTWQKV